jgi:PST family polysaccharide transporter
MAFNLSSWPVNMFSTAIEGVVLPGFARLQHDRAELRRTFLHWLMLLMLVSIPVSVVLATCAAPTIRVLYGDRWSPAAAALAGLAVLGLFRVAFHYVTDLLMAAGRGKSSLRLQAIWLAAVVPALAIGAHLDGIRGAGIAHVVVAVVIMLPLFVVAVRWLGIGLADLGTTLRRPLAAGLVAAALALVARSIPGGSGTRSELIRLVFVGALAVAGYALVIAPLALGLLRARQATREGEDNLALSEAAA